MIRKLIPVDSNPRLLFAKVYPPEEYSIPERDAQAGPEYSFDLGVAVSVTRIVTRVGYKHNACSFSMKEWMRVYAKELSKSQDATEDEIYALLVAMNFYSPYKLIPDKFLRQHLLDELRVSKGTPEDLWRRMWFIDVNFTGTLVSRVRRWTGQYEPASGDFDDYESARLNPRFNQNLYRVQSNRYYDIIVHPLDIEVYQC